MLDYALIRQILEELYDVYPKALRRGELKCLQNTPHDATHKILFYLAEHNMLTMPVNNYLGGNRTIGRLTITKTGIDFIQPDGGLSMLAAPVIRIAPENITALIDTALTARNIPADQRGVIQKTLGVAGTEGVKTIVQRLIDAGITHSPDILRLFTLP